MSSAPHVVAPSVLVRLIERARSTTVCVVGDLMLDEWIVGEAHRVSPEAPVPVVRVAERRRSLGGAAHVARVVSSLGAAARVVGVVGADAAGASLAELLADEGIDAAGVVIDPDRPTTHKTRVVAGQQQVVRFDAEVDVPPPASTSAELVARLRELPPVEVFVLSDYCKGVVDEAVIAEVVRLARRWGATVLVDPKHPALDRYTGVDVVKLNRREFEAATGLLVGDDPVASLRPQLAGLRHELGVGSLVVTLGGGGMLVVSAEAEPVVLPALELEVFDVAGAGDVVAGIMGLALAAGIGPVDAAGVANVAAGLSVSKVGTAAVSPSELVDRLVARPAAAVLDRAELATRVEAWRLAGHRVVFTNGCFDLFHAGHLELLRHAAALGDRLVVAVDSDESVRRLKGPARPLMAEAERTSILAALDVVDAVVTFDDDLVELVDTVRPDVLVKGADYAGREVVGSSIVEARGGVVVLVPLLSGHSTTAIVDRVRSDAPAEGSP